MSKITVFTGELDADGKKIIRRQCEVKFPHMDAVYDAIKEKHGLGHAEVYRRGGTIEGQKKTRDMLDELDDKGKDVYTIVQVVQYALDSNFDDVSDSKADPAKVMARVKKDMAKLSDEQLAEMGFSRVDNKGEEKQA